MTSHAMEQGKKPKGHAVDEVEDWEDDIFDDILVVMAGLCDIDLGPNRAGFEAALFWFGSWKDRRNLHHAIHQGCEAFRPAMLPNIWRPDCPYSTPVYAQAFMHGFYSHAMWFMTHTFMSMAALLEFDVRVPDETLSDIDANVSELGNMVAWYRKHLHNHKALRRVPFGQTLIDLNKKGEPDDPTTRSDDAQEPRS
jgi:hypothetical protein